MSKRTDRKRRHRSAHKPVSEGSRAATDRTVYGLTVAIGFFATAIGWLITADTNPHAWRVILLAYIAVVAWLINLYAFQAIRAKHLSGWQYSLARIPLRPLGYGTKEGKPMDAVHSDPNAPKALLASVIISLVVLTVCSALLLRGVTW